MFNRSNGEVVLALLVGVVGVAAARADVDPLSGIDLVRIGAVNNRGYDGPDPLDRVAGRGSVGYEYNIGRYEITTSQWLEYVNTFTARSDGLSISQIGFPVHWGAGVDPTYTGAGTRYTLRNVPNAGMLPVASLTWRQAAMYTNWLSNDKSSDLSARLNGAYDASTFAFTSPGVWTDQPTHSPGARYWIPTLDEWIKAVHFDPIATGPNGEQGRWWLQPNGTDIPLTYGPPGQGQANSGFTLPNGGEWSIPLGSYPQTVSPWGLLDAAGGTAEWTESIRTVGALRGRIVDGSAGGLSATQAGDLSYSYGDDSPASGAGIYGFRIASSVPSPGVPVVFGIGALYCCRRRRSCVDSFRRAQSYHSCRDWRSDSRSS